MNHGVLNAYSGYLKNENSLVKSSSGGFAYALSLKIIEACGVVYSVRYSKDFRIAEWDRATSLKELEAFRGSKYVESRKVYEGFNLFNNIKQDLEKGLQVLAIGLPCDIGAIKNYLKKDYNNLYTADLICHGPTVKKVAEDFLNVLESKYKSKVVNFTVRYKKDGLWTPPYMKVEFESGKRYLKPFYLTDYGIAFSIISTSCCYNCKFKGENHRSDLTIGDYWGLTSQNYKEWNKKGVSVAFVRTEKGSRLIDAISDLCNIILTDNDYAAKNNRCGLNEQKVKSKYYDIFKTLLYKRGLHEAVKCSYPVKKRITYFVKIFIKRHVPYKIIALLKWILSF